MPPPTLATLLAECTTYQTQATALLSTLHPSPHRTHLLLSAQAQLHSLCTAYTTSLHHADDLTHTHPSHASHATLANHRTTLLALINLDRERIHLAQNRTRDFWPIPKEAAELQFYISARVRDHVGAVARRLLYIEAVGGVGRLGGGVPRYRNIVGGGSEALEGEFELAGMLGEGVEGRWDMMFVLLMVGYLTWQEAFWEEEQLNESRQDGYLKTILRGGEFGEDVDWFTESMEQDEGGICSICGESKEDDVKTRCGHRICVEDLRQWIKSSEGANHRCPQCRQRLCSFEEIQLGDVKKAREEYLAELDCGKGRALDEEVDKWLLDYSRIKVGPGHTEDADVRELGRRLWDRRQAVNEKRGYLDDVVRSYNLSDEEDPSDEEGPPDEEVSPSA